LFQGFSDESRSHYLQAKIYIMKAAYSGGGNFKPSSKP